MIETSDLSKQFNDFWAVEGVDLHVKPGQILALLGQNGAGKTTTVRMLTALLRPTRGWARVAGYDVAKDGNGVRASVGVLTEQQGLYVRMNAIEYLDYFAEVHSLSPKTRRARCDYLLEYFGLAQAARQRIGTFSKGMRQKLALARALMHEPPVLLLDEPTSAMDPESARLVRDEIANLKSSQRAIVICTHNLGEAETLADIVVIIYRGRILMQGTLEELKDRVLGPVEFTARLSQAWDARGLELPEGVEMRTPAENQVRFQVERPRETNPRLMAALAAAQAPVLTFEEAPRSLEQVYLKVMAEAQGESMWDNLRPVWLVARRELRDQVRDWRVLFPLVVLTLGFPFIMNVVARQTVAFVQRYGADLVIDSLVPFSILIIGFFPNTISLVVALESFVGEKERGTIEPLLSLPLYDWQIYLGKFLVGALTPLAASYTAISLYLVMVRHLNVTVPSTPILIQLYVLTAAHTVLMVSGAIVVSVQSTSVKAANLLASFVILPVAFLLQGESVLLFWGNGRILWLAVVAVVIIAFLLIRVGIAHFQREYLLGREMDVLNFRWMWSTFWASFRQGARSPAEWYRQAVFPALRKLGVPLLIMLAIALVGGWLGYTQVTENAPALLKGNSSIQDMADLSQRLREMPSFLKMGASLNVPSLLVNNIRATTMMFVAGLISFGVLGIVIYLINVGLIGGVLSLFAYLGVSPLLVFAAGLLPHGFFELPALLLSGAVVLHVSVALVTPQLGRSLGEVLIDLIAEWAKVFVGIVVPLLCAAAVIETYITPLIIQAVFK